MLFLSVIAICLIISAICLLFFSRFHIAFEIILHAFFIFLASVVLLILGSIYVSFTTDEPVVEDYRFDIVAAGDTYQTNGRMGVFSGYINEKAYYLYYYPLGNGRFSQGKIEEAITIVVEKPDIKNPYIIVYKADNCGSKWYGLNLSEKCAEYRAYELIVPSNSIIRQTTLDLQD